MWKQLIFMAVVFTIAAGEIDFMDCGSQFDVIKVTIENCSNSPCRIGLAEKRKVTVEAKNLDVLDARDMKTEAYVSHRGLPFFVQITPADPCPTWGCPLRNIARRTFEGVVDFSNIYMMVRARLGIHLMYRDMQTGNNRMAVCVEILIDLGA